MATFQELALDTETTGLSPYHGDRLFSLIIACSEDEAYYFNFQKYEGLHDDWILDKATHLVALIKALDGQEKVWFMHNAVYDLHMLGQEQLELQGSVHCTMSNARVAYNEHMTYSLAACGERIGKEKSDAVEEYIKKEKLWEWEEIPGKKTRNKRPFYERVPLEVIAPYGLQDAKVCFALGRGQRSLFGSDTGGSGPTLGSVHQNEVRLTKTVYRIERKGIRVDKEYSRRALRFEESRARGFESDYQLLSGTGFCDSPKQLSEVLQRLGINLPRTDKGNPSTRSEILEGIDHPICKAILGHRDAKSKMDFYNGFLFFADGNDRIHPSLIAGGTATGRFASSAPNFQNLTNEEDESPSTEFLVRRAIIPSDGTFFFNPDQSQVEYRLMLDYAGELGLIRKILEEGLDVHEATGRMMGVTRKQAKTLNFMLLYGGGYKKLARALGIGENDARRLRDQYFSALPGVSRFIRDVMRTAEVRGYVRNWMGRRSYFPNKEYAYAAPNYLIQGGCADVIKVAMNRIDDLLIGKGTKMIMQVHDELLFEMPYGEEYLIPEIQKIMETAYPHKHIPLTVELEVAYKSWADKEKYGTGTKNVHGNSIQGAGVKVSGGAEGVLQGEGLVSQDSGSIASGSTGHSMLHQGTLFCDGVKAFINGNAGPIAAV